VGQYHGYDIHVATDKKLPPNGFDSHVPTAAVVTLTSDDPKCVVITIIIPNLPRPLTDQSNGMAGGKVSRWC